MLKDKIINEIVNNLENKNDMLCLICFFKIKDYKKKEVFTIEEVKELLTLISILKKNIENIKDKKLLKELKEEIYDDLIGYKKDYEKLVKIEKEEILTYIKNINEIIKIIQKDKNINEDVKNKLGSDILSF